MMDVLAISVLSMAISGPATLRMHKHMTHRPASSRVVESILGGNGSSIPADGSVWPTAIYWCYVEVGTPPVSFPVAIDSGSGDLDISGKDCVGCVTTPPNKQYDSKASSTSRAVFPFEFQNSYQTCDLKHPTAVCTISGRLWTDKVSLAGLGPVPVKFGAIEKQTSNFDQFKQIDGVLGFTMGGSENVFSQLVAAGKADNVWSICMHEGSKSNGTITIGGVDPRLSDKVEYVPDTGSGFHSVMVKSITLAATDLRQQAKVQSETAPRSTIPVMASAILDTGTNILLAPAHVMKSLQDAMCKDSSLASCTALWSGTCVTLSASEIAAYPALTMQLDNNVELEMSSKDYLLLGSPLASSPDQYCLGIRDGGDAGGGFIIGDTTMRNYYLVFDLAQHQIGWGKVNKDTCGSV